MTAVSATPIFFYTGLSEVPGAQTRFRTDVYCWRSLHRYRQTTNYGLVRRRILQSLAWPCRVVESVLSRRRI